MPERKPASATRARRAVAATRLTGARQNGASSKAKKTASAESKISEADPAAKIATGESKLRRMAGARKPASAGNKISEVNPAAKTATGRNEPGMDDGEAASATAEPPPKIIRRRRRKLSTRARVGLMATKLLPEVEAAVEETSKSNTAWTRSRVDKVIQLGRLLEKLGEFSRSAEEKQKIAKDRENEIAGTLEAIDRRIVELAISLAARIGKNQ